MLVCLCKGVSDRTVREEINRGAVSLSALQQSCQVGTDCGACVGQVRKMLAMAQPARSERSEKGGS